jgi:hypothetical protein
MKRSLAWANNLAQVGAQRQAPSRASAKGIWQLVLDIAEQSIHT